MPYNRGKPIGFALILLLALSGSPASAAEGDLPSVCHAAVKSPGVTLLERGEQAPFTGDLFSPTRSICLGLRHERCQEKSHRDLTRVIRRGANELQAEKDRGVARADANAARIEALERELEESTGFFRQPLVVVTITAIVVGGLAAALFAAAKGDGSGVYVVNSTP